jgi:hypothetical protein
MIPISQGGEGGTRTKLVNKREITPTSENPGMGSPEKVKIEGKGSGQKCPLYTRDEA